MRILPLKTHAADVERRLARVDTAVPAARADALQPRAALRMRATKRASETSSPVEIKCAGGRGFGFAGRTYRSRERSPQQSNVGQTYGAQVKPAGESTPAPLQRRVTAPEPPPTYAP